MMALHLCISRESLILTIILLYPPSSDILISPLTVQPRHNSNNNLAVQYFNLGLLKFILLSFLCHYFSCKTLNHHHEGATKLMSDRTESQATTEHLATTVVPVRCRETSTPCQYVIVVAHSLVTVRLASKWE